MTEIRNTQILSGIALANAVERAAAPRGEARMMPKTASGAQRFPSRMDGADAAEPVSFPPQLAHK